MPDFRVLPFTFSGSRAFVPLRVIAVAIGVLGFWSVRSQLLDAALDEQLDATCRIAHPGPGGQTEMGTGCVFRIAGGRVLVLTCAHVVEGAAEVSCEFWHRGHQSRALRAAVIGTAPGADLAVVALDAQQFGGVLPRVLPLAAPDETVAPGETVQSAGCAGGAWATALKGHARGYAGMDLYFVPAPANGRSGSAICNHAGRIVGIVRARTADDSTGIATAIQAAYAIWGSDAQQRTALAALNIRPAGRLVPVACESAERIAQSGGIVASSSAVGWPLWASESCPADGCQGGICDPYGVQPRWYLLPYRYREQFRNQPAPQPSPSPAPGAPGPTWPTLPAPPPSQSEIGSLDQADLQPVNQRLDRIVGLLEQLLAGMAAATPQQSAAPQAQSGDSAFGAPLSAAARVEDQLQAAREETGRLRQAVEAVIANRDEIIQRVQERLEKVRAEQGAEAGPAQLARAYARDFAAEQLSTGAAGLTAGSLLASALGLSGPLAIALGGGLWLLSRRIGARLEGGAAKQG